MGASVHECLETLASLKPLIARGTPDREEIAETTDELSHRNPEPVLEFLRPWLSDDNGKVRYFAMWRLVTIAKQTPRFRATIRPLVQTCRSYQCQPDLAKEMIDEYMV